jgi:hypothetical protein
MSVMERALGGALVAFALAFAALLFKVPAAY